MPSQTEETGEIVLVRVTVKLHDLSDFRKKTRKVKFDVVLEPEATYYPTAKDLSDAIQSEAHKQGVSSHAPANFGWSRNLLIYL